MASLNGGKEELLLDCEDYLRQHKLSQWPKDSPQAEQVRSMGKKNRSDPTDPTDPTDDCDIIYHCKGSQQTPDGQGLWGSHSNECAYGRGSFAGRPAQWTVRSTPHSNEFAC